MFAWLKGQPQAQGQGALAREFWSEVERVQPIILIRQIKQSNTDLRSTTREPIAGGHIELPEIVSIQLRQVLPVVLRREHGVKECEPTICFGPRECKMNLM